MYMFPRRPNTYAMIRSALFIGITFEHSNSIDSSSIRSSFKEICPKSWWCHQMEIFSASLALCAGYSPVTGEFPAQSPVTRSFDVFFDMRLNKWWSKQSRCRWFETPSRSLWRHCQCERVHGSLPNILPPQTQLGWLECAAKRATLK